MLKYDAPSVPSRSFGSVTPVCRSWVTSQYDTCTPEP